MILLSILSATAIASESTSTVVKANQTLASQPIAFTKNMGQWPDSILFQADAGGAVMWFVRDGIYHQYTKRIARPRSGEEALAMGLGPRLIDPTDQFHREPDSIETTMIKAEFAGTNPDVEVIGIEELDYKCNYFLGNDPAKWRTDVPNYSGVTFKELYPGVDASFGVREGRLEYRLTAASDAELAQVRTEYLCNGSVTEETENSVSLQTPVGERRFAGTLPLDENGSDETVTASTQSPNVGVSLVYSTYLGGGDEDWGHDIAVDSSGSAYVTGHTNSTNFPTLNPYQTDQDSVDVFVTKLSASGNSLLYSTYLGGGDDDHGLAIAVDGGGNAYVTGYTESADFPTLNPYQTDQTREDVFVTKLSPAGNSLVYSTYLGGGSHERGYGIAVDGSGSAYVTGYTQSTNFPTQNPYQVEHQGAIDVFVAKLSASGSSLLYSTYLGGVTSDYGDGIAVDGDGSAYVTGHTGSSAFPTQNPYQTNQGDSDAFVTKLSPAGNSLLYSTYLGGGSSDYGHDIAVDGSGSAYVTGLTWSTDFPTLNPYQAFQGDQDVFVTKLSASGGSLLYSSYLGGGSADYGYGIAVDGSGSAYVTGYTQSTNFPTQNPYQVEHQGAIDVFVAKLSASGSSLLYSTYLGGGHL